ncbi:Uncharacterised protein [Chlamydia trachomatis]|nr:Uncharacterised protein [Chlamydia trachomatis]
MPISCPMASESRTETRSVPRTSFERAAAPNFRAHPTIASATSGPGHVTSSEVERPGSISDPRARNAPRQTAAASSFPDATKVAGRPRTGRRRESTRPVIRASSSALCTTRTTKRLPRRSEPPETTTTVDSAL